MNFESRYHLVLFLAHALFQDLLRARDNTLFKKTNKSAIYYYTFYLEDDNRIKVDFNGETLSFTLTLNKAQLQTNQSV